MTRQADHSIRPSGRTERGQQAPRPKAGSTTPAFKPVALPALAAAVRRPLAPPARRPSHTLPAILRQTESSD